MEEQELVTIEQYIPLADSRQVAQELGIGHSDFFSNLITKYQTEIEEDFGVIRFENGKPPAGSKGGRPVRYALLTEDQTYAYLAYSKNTEQARACKRKLVKAFSAARKMLQQVESMTPPPVFPPQLLKAHRAMADWLALVKEQGEDNEVTDAHFELMRHEFAQVTPEDDAQWKKALEQTQERQMLLPPSEQDEQ